MVATAEAVFDQWGYVAVYTGCDFLWYGISADSSYSSDVNLVTYPNPDRNYHWNNNCRYSSNIGTCLQLRVEDTSVARTIRFKLWLRPMYYSSYVYLPYAIYVFAPPPDIVVDRTLPGTTTSTSLEPYRVIASPATVSHYPITSFSLLNHKTTVVYSGSVVSIASPGNPLLA